MKLKPFKKTTSLPDPQHDAALQAWLCDDPLDVPPAPIQTPATGPSQPMPLTAVVASATLPSIARNLNYRQPYRQRTVATTPVSRAAMGSPLPVAPPAPIAIRTTPSQPTVAPIPSTTPTISLNITLPSAQAWQPILATLQAAKRWASWFVGQIKALGQQAKPFVKAHKKGTVQATIVVVLVIGSLAGGQLFLAQKHSITQQTKTVAAKQTTSAPSTKPTVVKQPLFKPFVPITKPQLAITTAGVSAFDSNRNSYSFIDTFQDQAILVSQQPIPNKFKTDSEALTQIAQQVGAKEGVITNNGQAYMGTDSKSGQQTLVYVQKGILIFVQSPFSHSALKWQPYLESLHQT